MAAIVRRRKNVIEFVSPIHLKAFKLSIARSSDRQQCLSVSNDAATQVCLLIRPANGLLSLFVTPLALIYDADEQNLRPYLGNVNITDDRGKALTAVINYQYPNREFSFSGTE